VVLIPLLFATPTFSGAIFTLKAFVVTVLGGLGNIGAAIAGGQLFVFADEGVGIDDTEDDVCVLHLPHVHEALAPLLYTLPLQLLSYHVAVLKGTDVDQPRNLAKSVTVE
jgi:glucosamine 6-phosphate synthetase-like amidotransferase/phosphosugar isomerase protein